MAALSFTMSHGASGMKLSDFTTGTSAPGGGDFEVRWNTSNTNGKTILTNDVILFLKAAIRMIEQGGTQVNLVSLGSSGLTPPPPLT